jgi:hypothetical protein
MQLSVEIGFPARHVCRQGHVKAARRRCVRHRSEPSNQRLGAKALLRLFKNFLLKDALFLSLKTAEIGATTPSATE